MPVHAYATQLKDLRDTAVACAFRAVTLDNKVLLASNDRRAVDLLYS